MRDVPTFLSVRDLIKNKLYKIRRFDLVDTAKGRRARIIILSKEYKHGEAFVHLPERLYPLVEKNQESLNLKCQSSKGLYIVFKGVKGKAFDLRFKRMEG